MILLLVLASISLICLLPMLPARREIAVRKVIGSRANQLMMQFLTEAFLISAVGAVIAALSGQFTSRLNALQISSNELNWTTDPAPSIPALFHTAGTLLAGAYPVLYFRFYRKEMLSKAKWAMFARHPFSCSGAGCRAVCTSTLLVGTLVVSRQL